MESKQAVKLDPVETILFKFAEDKFVSTEEIDTLWEYAGPDIFQLLCRGYGKYILPTSRVGLAKLFIARWFEEVFFGKREAQAVWFSFFMLLEGLPEEHLEDIMHKLIVAIRTKMYEKECSIGHDWVHITPERVDDQFCGLVYINSKQRMLTFCSMLYDELHSLVSGDKLPNLELASLYFKRQQRHSLNKMLHEELLSVVFGDKPE